MARCCVFRHRRFCLFSVTAVCTIAGLILFFGMKRTIGSVKFYHDVAAARHAKRQAVEAPIFKSLPDSTDVYDFNVWENVTMHQTMQEVVAAEVR